MTRMEDHMKYLHAITASATQASDIIRWRNHLSGLHQRLRPYFARPEPWKRALLFFQALLSEVPRKNGWQMAEQAREATPYGMQRLLAEAVWDEDGVRDEVRQLAVETLGREQAVLAIDETCFLKQGQHSAGVAHQYCGITGRTENCQVGVFLSWVTPRGHTLIDRELYLPAGWTDDPVRCRKAGIPASVPFRTKPEQAHPDALAAVRRWLCARSGSWLTLSMEATRPCENGWKSRGKPTLAWFPVRSPSC